MGTGFHPRLSGRHNVFLNGAILGMTRREIAANFDAIVAFAGVERFIDTPVKLYSTGMLAGRPDAVLAYGDMESFGMEPPYRWPGPKGPAGDVLDAFRRKDCIRSPGQTVIRTAAIRVVGGFDAALAGADDGDLYLKLAGRGPFVYTGHLALRYRVHAGNQSKQAWRLFRRACRGQVRHAGRWPHPGQRLQWLAGRVTLVHMLVRDLLARRR